MYISFRSQQFAATLPQPPFSINWEAFDFHVVQSKGSVTSKIIDNLVLGETHLSCSLSTVAGKWENRKIFIKVVIEDILENCPKDEPLALVSFGSDRLLMEYLIGKILRENGFTQISFLLVDPAYLCSETEEGKNLKKACDDFCKEMGKENVSCLSHRDQFKPAFPKNANVVFLECLPSNAEALKEIKARPFEEKAPRELMIGSLLTPASQANAVTFIPPQHVEQLKKGGATLTSNLPFALYSTSKGAYYLDWGCKIKSDGTYSLSFTGADQFLESIGIKAGMTKLPSGEVVPISQLFNKIQEALERILSEEITSTPLSQQEITALLQLVEKNLSAFLPEICSYFSTDYFLDREEALEHIKENAGHHYRKTFSLKADAFNAFRIIIEEI